MPPINLSSYSGNTLNPGFMGIATIGSSSIRCTDFSVNIKQEPVFYDHTIGLRDSIPGSIFDGKGDVGAYNPQKIIWRPGVKLVQGGFTFPWTDTNQVKDLFDIAKRGDTMDDFSFGYSCDFGRTFSGCKMNSFSVKAAAGELITTTIDFIGKDMVDGNGSAGYKNIEKLITWDAASISLSGFDNTYMSYFEFTINNNCIPIYTSGGNNNDALSPYDIRVGMQMVTGAISFYTGKELKFLEEQINPSTINFSCQDGLSFSMDVILKPLEQNAAVNGPIIRTVAFVGVDKVFS